MMFRQSIRQRRATGSWLGDLVGGIDWNPMHSPVTQAVVGGTVAAAQGVAQVVTAPVTLAAQAVGVNINWDPTKSPLWGAAGPILDAAGVTLGVGPLGQYVGLAGSLTQSNYNKPATAPGGTIVYQVQQQQAPAAGGAGVYGPAPVATVAGGVKVAANTRRGWPGYYARG